MPGKTPVLFSNAWKSQAAVRRWYHGLVWLQTLQTESITGTSTSTPTTVASAAGESAEKVRQKNEKS